MVSSVLPKKLRHNPGRVRAIVYAVLVHAVVIGLAVIGFRWTMQPPSSEVVQAVAVPDSIPAELLLRRPDVTRAERDLQAAAARVGLALGNRLPRVMLTGTYGRQSQDFQDFFSQDNEIYVAQVGISIPLFTGGRLADQQGAARARLDQARARYEQTVLQALREGSHHLLRPNPSFGRRGLSDQRQQDRQRRL